MEFDIVNWTAIGELLFRLALLFTIFVIGIALRNLAGAIVLTAQALREDKTHEVNHSFSPSMTVAIDEVLRAYVRNARITQNQTIREEYQRLVEFQTAEEARKRLRDRYPDLTGDQLAAIVDPLRKTRS